ncbi:right-handed parallel beta-helix repeat-containing protein [Butyrivibrio sp.]|uniref:right-handed parallel beta-helix repeat-containing protein n=1 Tax=Butyrivibrio sp. TaxID=28121 RepID=UPI0025BAD9F3|nr:right-handed parallel beta-helix repeat-containing protein [Butyrivibrio sp.]
MNKRLSLTIILSFVFIGVGSFLVFTVKAEAARVRWEFASFGTGTSDRIDDSGYMKNDDGSVTLWSLNKKGKIVSESTDGLSFYYVTIPSDKNFTLTATAVVDSWTFTNGQEGFGLMASDRVGEHGDNEAFWNNSYMALGGKIEYYYDPQKGEVVNDESHVKITMKNGLGVLEKSGVTMENLSLFEANDTVAVNQQFSSNIYPLETSCAAFGTGVYNIWGNEQSGLDTTVNSPLTEVRLRIQKNNTGYFVSYLDEKDNVIAMKKFYEPKALEQIDGENVYVGFFASRTVKATYKDIALAITDPLDDAPAEERPITYVDPSYKVVSASYANSDDYLLEFLGNADGKLTVTNSYGEELFREQTVRAGEVIATSTTLKKGVNSFKVVFTPDENFTPDNDEYKRLSSYETDEFNYAVKYETINDGEKIYVSPGGDPNGDGNNDHPVDIYTAVKYVKPGQTIVLEEGLYSLDETVTVYRGINGTKTRPISMITNSGRAVFDFNGKCAGFVFGGDYWYVKGIDCTGSGDGCKGIQISGSFNTFEDVYTYKNGNTGLQVSRFHASDEYEMWPSDNLILHCISCGNADSGFEDADGFAAKLTVGERNVFDGCISYNNADDGWDLFARIETGSIGKVTIQNCVSFSNGYGLDGAGQGNGNGFKMGGSSMPGQHKLINSAAWGNKGKGIDSNSGPDIQIYDCIAFNNGSYNVALYTNGTLDTSYYVDGLISYRTKDTGVGDKVELYGFQNEEDVYNTKNFFWNDEKSCNSQNIAVSDDWFESLDMPLADENNPLSVAMSLRTDDGSVDLGDFLKLSNIGTMEIEKAGSSTDSAKESSVDEKKNEASYENADDSEVNKDNEQNEEASGDEILLIAGIIIALLAVIFVKFFLI